MRRALGCLGLTLAITIIAGCSGSSSSSKPVTGGSGTGAKGSGTAPVEKMEAPPPK